MPRFRASLLPLVLAAALLAPVADAARREKLALRYQGLELPGAPASILAADLDGDGRQDLAVMVAYTEWDSLSIEESVAMDDVDGLVEVLTVVPQLLDRRELWAFLARPDGTYRAAGAPLALDTSVLSLAAGLPGLPVAALTDDGLSALRLGSSGALALEPVLEERPVLAKSRTFISELGLVHDFDADRENDLLFPTATGATVYRSLAGALVPRPASRLPWPRDPDATARVRHYVLPEVRDVDGDGLADLLLPDRAVLWRKFHVLRSLGEGRFGPLEGPLGETAKTGDGDDPPAVAYFGDLDGDGVAEYVTVESLTDPDAGLRKGMRQAKDPPFRYRFHRATPALAMVPEPYLELEVTGYAFHTGDDDLRVPGGFKDLDGDGRQDLVTLTLDFSILQAVRILATRTLSLGIDFHVWCQDGDGGFRNVRGLDLSGKFRLDLDNLRLGQLSQFAGDFDGDGRIDFVQIGRGKRVTIHRGQEGCSYPSDPDLAIELEEEPRALNLVQVRDLDADGLADLVIIQPQKVTEPGVTPPVRLDLYLSGDL